jgi:hypothetical protein
VTMEAEPTTLQAEDKLTLRVKIKIVGAGSLKQIQRPNLKRLPTFAKQFDIKNGGQRDLPSEKAREFDYELRPRRADVKQVPALPFVYFNPMIQPPARGYQRAYAPAIPLVVKPRAEIMPAEIEVTAAVKDAPDSVYRCVTGPAVVRQVEPFALPGPILLTILLVAPPVACAVWFAIWQRRYPDVARLARQRRSRAARQALKAIPGLEKIAAAEQALRAKEIFVEYLQERLDFRVFEPTPLEVAEHLEQVGAAPEIVRGAAQFFAACDAARFAHETPPVPSWGTAAATLVRDLEDQPWPSPAA